MYCWSCGTELHEGSNFCHVCGAAVPSSAANTKAAPPAEQPSPASSNQPNASERVPDSGHNLDQLYNFQVTRLSGPAPLVHLEVSVDGAVVGKLAAGNRLNLLLPVGGHQFHLRIADSTVDFVIHVPENTSCDITTVMDYPAAKPKLVNIYSATVAYPQASPTSYPHSEQQPVVFSNESPTTRKRDKWVSFILCFLFGIFGVHRFYEGKIGTGLLWLFTLGLLGIGVLCDLIAILCKPDRYY